MIIVNFLCAYTKQERSYSFHQFAAYRGPGATFDKNFDFKIRRDHGKISYERRVYESVYDKSQSWDILGYISKIDEKQNSCNKESMYA